MHVTTAATTMLLVLILLSFVDLHHAKSATVPLINVLCWQKTMIRSYYDVITISMLSAVISVSPDIFMLQWLTVLLHYGHSWIGFYCGL